MFALLSVLLLPRAHAACPVPLPPEALETRLDAATGRYRALDLEGFRTAMDETALALPCLDAAIPPPTAARYHRMQGLRSFVVGDEERAQQAFLAARRIDPGYRFPADLVPDSHPVREQYGALPLAAEGGAPLPPPDAGAVLLDGVEGTLRSSLAAAVFQLEHGGVVERSQYLWPTDPLPAYPGSVPPDTAGRSRGLVWSGVALVAAGALSYGGGALVRQRYDDPSTPVGELDTVRSTMHTLGGVGIGLAVVGGGLVVGGAAAGR